MELGRCNGCKIVHEGMTDEEIEWHCERCVANAEAHITRNEAYTAAYQDMIDCGQDVTHKSITDLAELHLESFGGGAK